MESFIDSKLLIILALLTFYTTLTPATTFYHHHHHVVVVVSGTTSDASAKAAAAIANAAANAHAIATANADATEKAIATANADATAKAIADANAAFFAAANIPCPPPPPPAARPPPPPPANPPPPNPKPVSRGAERDDFLRAHNEVRAIMHEAEFTWDTKLEQYARNYGAQRVEDCNMIHSDGPYGENLFEGGGNAWTAYDAVAKWLDEVKSYDMSHNSCQQGKMCGHYTQIIWKTSCKLGCARIICKNGDTFAICEYDPPGNYEHEKPLDGVQHESQL